MERSPPQDKKISHPPGAGEGAWADVSGLGGPWILGGQAGSHGREFTLCLFSGAEPSDQLPGSSEKQLCGRAPWVL